MKFYKMKDKSDNYTIINKNMFSLPARILIIGRTGAGKSGMLGNLLLRKDALRNYYKPENIFIFSGSLKGDEKLKIIINELDIPDSNLFNTFDEEIGNIIYDEIVENYNEALADKTKPEHTLFIFDDLGFTNKMNKNKKDSLLDRIFCNGRKFLVSTITLNQKITQLSTCAREQASSLILFSSSNKQLELVESDFNYLDNKKQFLKMIKKHTEDIHDFIIIDISKKNIYFNKEFKPICTCADEKKECGGI